MKHQSGLLLHHTLVQMRQVPGDLRGANCTRITTVCCREIMQTDPKCQLLENGCREASP